MTRDFQRRFVPGKLSSGQQSFPGWLLGGILAIPLTAAARVIMFRYVWRKREG